MVWCGGRKQCQCDILGANFRVFQCHAAGFFGKAAQRLVLLRPITCADPRPTLYPASLQPKTRLNLGVADTSRWHGMPEASHAGRTGLHCQAFRRRFLIAAAPGSPGAASVTIEATSSIASKARVRSCAVEQ